MQFDDLLKTGQLKAERTSKEKIAEFLQFAEDEISAAKFNLEKFPLTAYKSAYDALLHAGNALVRYYGFRPTSLYPHATIAEFVDRTLGGDYSILAKTFKQMRRKRHPLQYEAKFSESHEEIKKGLLRAEELVKKIEDHIQIKPLQERMF